MGRMESLDEFWVGFLICCFFYKVFIIFFFIVFNVFINEF